MTNKTDLRRQAEEVRAERDRFKDEAATMSQKAERLEAQQVETIAVLRELVRLHDLREAADKEVKETSASSQIASAFMEEYEDAMPGALSRARAVLEDAEGGT